ncbi:ribosome recycling factor [Saccharopolyspora hirsuta]|uniref:Ribosome-recycling factor n=1 Tax=Saccharopolyspora hirsuta TaxID=1837 RepID=A0A5M7BRZ3_SACHI|nr:ribosome recycling factor [Saccharopolyspora hirsuta]KAA5832552.1 ribosome recycling factor [Saccharopolyspora hirsuta]
MIDEALLEGEEKMQKAVERAKDELATVRTGRANPAMFSGIVVDYYGSPTPLNQLASVSVPEARLVVIKPYDASQLAAMEKAIRDSDLGVNPSNDGQLIRVAIPQMTEERRKEMVKLAKQKGEDGKVSVRGIRRKVKEEIDRIVKDGEAGEDEGTRGEKELDNLTHRYTAQIDDLVKHKEAELLEV